MSYSPEAVELDIVSLTLTVPRENVEKTTNSPFISKTDLRKVFFYLFFFFRSFTSGMFLFTLFERIVAMF